LLLKTKQDESKGVFQMINRKHKVKEIESPNGSDSKIKHMANARKHPAHYHNPLKLLKAYRDVRWSLKLSMEQHRQDFEAEYGMSISQYLDDIYAAGIEFAGTKLEHHANTMKRTADMLRLIDTATHLIREHNSDGELYYWILYYTYFSPQKLSNVDEIVERTKMHIPYITKDIYYKQRKKAIKVFSSVLWGFAARDEVDVLDAILKETFQGI
jgi:hypothetical protein